jgi:hypothetical protein
MSGEHPPSPAVCEWVKWCERPTLFEMELRNRAGSERIAVCRLHLAAAELYGYRRLDGGTTTPSPYDGVLGRDLDADPRPDPGPSADEWGPEPDDEPDEALDSEPDDERGPGRGSDTR